MRFLFVDRILELENNKHAVGIKNVSFSDEWLVDIAPNFPVMPRSLTIEAIAQLISWLVICSRDFTVKPVAVMTDGTQFTDDVRPGDQMLLRAEITSMHDDDALCCGTAEVDGKIVTRLTNGVCAFVPLDELEYRDDVRARAYALMGRKDLSEFITGGIAARAGDAVASGSDGNFRLCLVDKITKMEHGKCVQGLKSITMTEEYTVDHFPRKHIMPGTMIIESLVQLSEIFLAESVKSSRGVNIKILVSSTRKLKFRHYVVPGDQMLMDVNLVDLTEEAAAVKGKATVGGKVVTSAMIEFQIIELP